MILIQNYRLFEDQISSLNHLIHLGIQVLYIYNIKTFRYTPNTKVGQQYMIKLRYLIEETYELNGNSRVVLVAHSMGNPVTVQFLKTMSEVGYNVIKL